MKLSSIRDHAQEIKRQVESHPVTHGHFPNTVWVGRDAWEKTKIDNVYYRAPIDEFIDLFPKSVHWEMANDYRANGCMIMQELLKLTNGKPKTFYLAKGNQQFEEALQAATINPAKTEEYIKTSNWTDDVCDEARYGMVGIYTWLTGEKQASASRIEAQKYNEQFINTDWYNL